MVNVGQKPITKRILQGSMHYLTAKSKFVYFQMRSPHDGNVEQSHTLQIISQEGLSNDKKIGWMSNSRRRSGVIFTLFAGIYWDLLDGEFLNYAWNYMNTIIKIQGHLFMQNTRIWDVIYSVSLSYMDFFVLFHPIPSWQ